MVPAAAAGIATVNALAHPQNVFGSLAMLFLLFWLFLCFLSVPPGAAEEDMLELLRKVRESLRDVFTYEKVAWAW